MPNVEQIDLSAFPPLLQRKSNWVVWNYQQRGEKRTKVPFSPTGGAAKSNDASTWGTLDAAQQAFSTGRADGIGFMFDGSVFGVDIDHCINTQTGEVSKQAASIVQALNSYTEYSPSDTGLHILCIGNLRAQFDFDMLYDGNEKIPKMTVKTVEGIQVTKRNGIEELFRLFLFVQSDAVCAEAIIIHFRKYLLSFFFVLNKQTVFSL